VSYTVVPLLSVLRVIFSEIRVKRPERRANTVIEFDTQRTVHRDIFLQYNQNDALISEIYFCNRTLHVSDRFSVLLASSQLNLYDIPNAVFTVLDS